MSGPATQPLVADDLLCDEGVLHAVATCEWHGWNAVARLGGIAVLPWRAAARAAQAADVQVIAPVIASAATRYAQVVVRIGKGRAATAADLAAAWQVLAPGGRLVISGTNDVGISTWAKRVSLLLGVSGTVLANRAHARVVAFERSANTQVTDDRFTRPADTLVPLPDGTPLQVAPGVFSGDGLDGGTKLLLDALKNVDLGADFRGKIVDVGCGAGHLGIAAARQFPLASVTMLDADARAVACATANVHSACPQVRTQVQWWDDYDAWPVPDADLGLLNPPCHAGTTVDLTAARRLFSVAQARQLLMVANRQLAYEADVRRLGAVTCVAENERFKVLSVVRG